MDVSKSTRFLKCNPNGCQSGPLTILMNVSKSIKIIIKVMIEFSILFFSDDKGGEI